VHLPDGFLSASVVAATWVTAGVGVAGALRAERRDPMPAPAGVLGAAAAFIFAAQMINVPVAPGTSGHLVGAALAAALLGPWRGLIVMAVVLAVQALLFQDGGLSALGANITDMGLGGVLTGYAVAALVTRVMRSERGCVAGAVVGAFAATLVSAVLTALWLGLSGLYPLRAILPLMLLTHVFVGVLEAALTGAIVTTVVRWRPDLVRGLSASARPQYPAAAILGALGLALAVAAFVSPFASALPDGLEHTAAQLGFAGRATAYAPSPFPDYAMPLLRSSGIATAMAGIVGTLVTAALAWVISRGLRSSRPVSHE
jgi:cobalt/nickel transport system permease protein